LAALQANQMQQQVATSTAEGGGSMSDPSNILYSHLTKETETPSVRSLSSNEQNPEADGEATEPDLDGEVEAEGEASGKPEDLSAAGKVMTPSQSPNAHSPSGSRSPEPLAKNKNPENPNTTSDCKKILDNMLFKMGGLEATTPPEHGSESEGSFQDTSNPHTNNNDVLGSDSDQSNFFFYLRNSYFYLLPLFCVLFLFALAQTNGAIKRLHILVLVSVVDLHLPDFPAPFEPPWCPCHMHCPCVCE